MLINIEKELLTKINPNNIIDEVAAHSELLKKN